MTDHGRRRLLTIGGGLLIAGGIVPQRWRKPVIDTVLLPAHAQGSPMFTALVSIAVRSATVETRTPSGGAPTPAIATIRLHQCDNPDPALLSVTASVSLSPSGTLSLAGGSVAIDPATQEIVYTVPTNIVADISLVTQLSVTATYAGASFSATETGAALTSVLTGSSLPVSCP